MNACKSDQSRQPLVPSERNSAATTATSLGPRTREVSSRYKSHSRTSTPTSAATRCPSPVTSTSLAMLDHAGQYITDGLDRARDSLAESAALREKFILTSVTRRVAAAAASAAKEVVAAMSGLESAAYKGLQQCIETVMSEDLVWFRNFPRKNCSITLSNFLIPTRNLSCTELLD